MLPWLPKCPPACCVAGRNVWQTPGSSQRSLHTLHSVTSAPASALSLCCGFFLKPHLELPLTHHHQAVSSDLQSNYVPSSLHIQSSGGNFSSLSHFLPSILNFVLQVRHRHLDIFEDRFLKLLLPSLFFCLAPPVVLWIRSSLPPTWTQLSPTRCPFCGDPGSASTVKSFPSPIGSKTMMLLSNKIRHAMLQKRDHMGLSTPILYTSLVRDNIRQKRQLKLFPKSVSSARLF